MNSETADFRIINARASKDRAQYVRVRANVFLLNNANNSCVISVINSGRGKGRNAIRGNFRIVRVTVIRDNSTTYDDKDNKIHNAHIRDIDLSHSKIISIFLLVISDLKTKAHKNYYCGGDGNDEVCCKYAMGNTIHPYVLWLINCAFFSNKRVCALARVCVCVCLLRESCLPVHNNTGGICSGQYARKKNNGEKNIPTDLIDIRQ